MNGLGKRREFADSLVRKKTGDEFDYEPKVNPINEYLENLWTVGSGNHFVDLFEEAGTGRLWVANHFGS
ncbi:hypothetical protein PATA110616_17110 [Paenibacillus tarimensis]